METERVILLLFKISSNDVNKMEEHLKQAKNRIYSLLFFFGRSHAAWSNHSEPEQFLGR